MKLEALNNNVIIIQDENEQLSSGRLVVADMGQEKPKTGVVKAVGPGFYSMNGTLIPMQAKLGDRIVFTAFSGTKITVDNIEYIAVKDADIIAIIKNDNE